MPVIMVRGTRWSFWLAIASGFLFLLLMADPSAGSQPPQGSSKGDGEDLQSYFTAWLEQDVVYIITPEERAVFEQQQTDSARLHFIEQFWLRRDPTPATLRNEFKEQHYRRIDFANERFSSCQPGWKTDRGRVYIMWGPPDEIESHPSGGYYVFDQGGGIASTYPFEIWRYRYLEGIGEGVMLVFVDPTESGEYRLTTDLPQSDAWGMRPWSRDPHLDMPNRRIFVAPVRPPQARFGDLEALLAADISFDQLPFEVRTQSRRVTDASSLVFFTVVVKKKDVLLKAGDDGCRAEIHVFGRVRNENGHIVEVFEGPLRIDLPEGALAVTYEATVVLRPGLYELDLALEDVNSEKFGTAEIELAVPGPGENLAR